MLEFYEMNPFIRFAETIFYHSENHEVLVRDCRIFYILSGEADLFIENQHYSLKPDSLFYCCAKNRYCINSAGVTLISLNFDLSQNFRQYIHPFFQIPVEKSSSSASDTEPELSHISWNKETILDCDCLNRHYFLPHAQAFQESLTEILNEFSTQQLYFQERSSALLKDILIRLQRLSVEASSHAEDAVSTAIAYLKSNYAQEITNQSLSAMTGYHEYHLNRLFLKHTGTSIHQYLLSVRISAAKKLLINTALPMSVLAEKTGFGSKTHFSSAFKKVVGITPSQYRKHFQNTI